MNSFKKIRQLQKSDSAEALRIFKAAYKNMDVPKSELAQFQADLDAAFDNKHINRIVFFALCDDDGVICAFAGIEPHGFMRGSWALRWGTTHPDHQKKGLMSALTDHRINYAFDKTSDIPGMIHICSRRPGLYLKKGFKRIYTRGPTNKACYLVKYFNESYRDQDI